MCQIEGCERDVVCKGLCRAHYMREYRGSKNKDPIEMRKRISCPACGYKMGARGCFRCFQAKTAEQMTRIDKDAGAIWDNGAGKLQES